MRQALSLPNGLLFFLMVAAAVAQDGDPKRPLDHDDYDRWNVITTNRISNDGKWVLYGVQDGKQKTTIKLRNAHSDKQYSIPNGAGARFTFDSQFAVYRVEPDKELIKKLKKEKKKPEEMPQAHLEILHLESGKLATVERARSFQLPAKNGDWIGVLLQAPETDTERKPETSKVGETYEVTAEGLQRPGKKAKPAEKKKKPTAGKEKQGEPSKEQAGAKAGPGKEASPEKAKKPVDKSKSAGTVLILRNLQTGYERRFDHVKSFQFSENGQTLAFATAVKSDEKTKSDPEQDGVGVFDLDKLELRQVINGLGNYKNLAVSVDGKHVAFLTDRDDYQSKHSSWSLYYCTARSKDARKIATQGTKGVPQGWWVSENSAPFFSENNRRLFFGTAPQPEHPEEEDEDKEPEAKLDIWHWKDPQLQPQQLLQAERERRRSYQAVYDMRTRKVIQLATTEMPDVSIDRRSDADVAAAVSRKKYEKMMSWDMPGFQDTYIVNLKNGSARMVIERARNGGRLSPAGKYVIWWDTDSQAWFAIPTKTDGEQVEISAGIDHPLYNELHDTPSEPRPYGIEGWMEDDRYVIVKDRFDLWKLDPTGDEDPVCLTQGVGRENHWRFDYRQLDREERFVADDQTMLLTFQDEDDKSTGVAELTLSATDEDGETENPRVLIQLDEAIEDLSKARDSDAVLFTRSTFARCPDLWCSTLAMKKITRISQINPQQQEYNWGTAELVHWESANGEELDGLLYKPEDFDPEKKYPMLVYFYERNSDNLHSYYAPAAGRSIINLSFYVSRGYVLFVPDIPYQTGYPGQSAADSILPGVEHILSMGFVDKDRVGMQGHSWGGYQTAYLVTVTDMFACAESGAPVSNMTSAYGGIRWGSGMSRMFQYERTQSRIGKTLWEDRELYIKNSPLFNADKINTPLLILHNDEDGAVPWYQGIELFVALRRLEKPAWLLNYNGNPHWVMGEENRRDFARRMQQFFDHYLMDGPLPKWMDEGIPAVDKGQDFGFETVAEEGSGEASESGESTEK